jgi:hypothetical protein
MPDKKPATISALLTVVILIFFAIVTVLLQMIALNGASQGQGMTAVTLP